MKILKKGNDWNKWSIKYECDNNGINGCGSFLEINVDDISYESSLHSNDHYVFECPVCKSRKYIDGDLIPYQVKQIIKYRNSKGN